MHLRQEILENILSRFVDAGVTERHRRQSNHLYTSVYGIDEDDPDIQLLFDIAIQNRARSLSPEEYRRVSSRFDPNELLNCTAHEDAVQYLLEIDDVGPKIVDEFLRKAVHVMGVKPEWESELRVPLDTHVIKALVKTGAIDLDDRDWDDDLNRSYQRVVNSTSSREVSPRTRIGYFEFQDSFAEVSERYNLPRIVFDELWIEHSRFISNPLLQSKSVLFDLILGKFRF